MLRRKVTAPDGRTWTLGRRWMPRRQRLARVDIGSLGFPDLGAGGLDDLGIVGAILAAIMLVILAVVLALVLFNVIAIALELLIPVILLVTGVIGRVLFRRPWTVFALTPGVRPYEAQVVGWRASRRVLDDAAARLASGLELQGPPRDGR